MLVRFGESLLYVARNIRRNGFRSPRFETLGRFEFVHCPDMILVSAIRDGVDERFVDERFV